MSFKNRHTTILLITILIILIVIDGFVVVKFFTDDKLEEVTFSKASLPDYENTITSQLAKLDNPETYVFPEVKKANTNQDVLESTNEIEVSKTYINPTTTTASSTYTSTQKQTTSSRSSTQKRKTENSESKNSNTSTNIPKGQISIGMIEIPKTNVNLPILKDITVAGMEVATCMMYSTGSLNISGTTVIIGHNYCNGKLFSNNNKLQKGDKIIITTTDGNKKEYTIYDKFITTEEDISYLERNTNNEPQIALSTCTNNEEKRIVILAK